MGGTDVQKPTVDLEYALDYLSKVKARFQSVHPPQIYTMFVNILKMYRKGEKSVDEVIREVNLLFEGHDDLIEEFTNFLP
ncbi:unnamed protein product [Lathyrus oleraceus]|uniref:Uncharacterized protein n=2 Tax=Pisum sativum TaxID=3888 RepID=A0A9D4YCX0_PEA|nr:hypothetical protein KIW84_023417 [Pisum sativum]